ncbi:unnamed protein product [Euphydryas editha]|uniref:FLYWCH-type domain-containing protein n=1 Tax=Euphydryas editha TaxID=104508 RepID=A0AAU9TFA9_EUPED|nr:unnamed protein product [Euphydryas editha]
MRYWYCTKKFAEKCLAKIRLDAKRRIVNSYLQHTHQAPRIFKTKDVTVVTLSTGNTFLIINGHTFRKEVCVNGATSRWCCNEPSQSNCITVLEFDDVENDVDWGDDNVAMFLESKKGKTILQYDGYRYRKAYKTKNGTRWNCSLKKNCSGFVYLNDQDEIIMTSKYHDHPKPNLEDGNSLEPTEQDLVDTAVVITSRKGKEMLLFRSYTYRKQYDKGKKSRWVCSTLKNCRAYVFTDSNNLITSAFEEHEHDPPKYYLNPNHLLGALREPLVFESD